jgi:hypothetical protein
MHALIDTASGGRRQVIETPLAAPDVGVVKPAPSELRLLRVDAGVCLQTVDAQDFAQGLVPEPVQQALAVKDPTRIVAIITWATPTEMTSIHRQARRAYSLRVTTFDVEGPTVLFERPIDRQTAELVAKLWRALTRRTSTFEVDEAVLHGTCHYFEGFGGVGLTVSPRNGSPLERTLFAVNWLREIVEGRERPDSNNDIRHIREELRDARDGVDGNAPCVRLLERVD